MSAAVVAANALTDKLPTGLYIGGHWIESQSGRGFVVENPATASELATVADAGPEDGRAALEAAYAAQGTWESTPPRVRSEILGAAFEALLARREEFASLITLEAGKPLAESRDEVTYAAEYLRWFSQEAVRIGGRTSTAPDGKSRLWINRRAVGPCLLITPWNFPLAMVTRKLAPAIAAGCTAIVKPAELTPLTALLLAQLFSEVGLPAGVLNVVTTSAPAPLSADLLGDPRLRKLSFTGSTDVGRHLLRLAADHVVRTSMELGGSAPFIVCEDAHIGDAVVGAIHAKMRNAGQACTAANRFLVHESVAEEFTITLATRLSELRVGNGIDPNTQVGPLINQQSVDKMTALVKTAVSNFGAQTVSKPRASDGVGYFFTPTVLADLDPSARILSEEIFGPVAPVSTFSTDDDAITHANATEYGLAAYLYTRDLDRALWMTHNIAAGMVALNSGVISNPAAPFGGIKKSGLGREGGSEGIEEYLDIRYTSLPG